MIKALLLNKQGETIAPTLTHVSEADLPEGEVVVDVAFSSLNYKDGLAVTNKGKIVRGGFPFVPGIDLAGRVVASEDDRFAPGDAVLQTGWGLGEDRWGGYAERQRVRADHLVRVPDGLSLRHAMTIGTAGFTAMLSVMALEEHGVVPGEGEVVVTGASGGVGSMAVALLGSLGYTVVASTGSTSAQAQLAELGAARFIGRDVLGGGARRPLDSAQWAGAVDTVGGPTLAAIISQLDRHGSVAACGLAQSHTLDTTVFPFILRGVNLLGIDSNTCPYERRVTAWERLGDLLSPAQLDALTTDIDLDDVIEYSHRIVRGDTTGRVVVRLRGA